MLQYPYKKKPQLVQNVKNNRHKTQHSHLSENGPEVFTFFFFLSTLKGNLQQQYSFCPSSLWQQIVHISNWNTVIHYWHFRPIKFISLGVLTQLSANKAQKTKTSGTSLKNIDFLSSFLSSLWWNFSAFKNIDHLPKHESKTDKIYFYIFLHVYPK